MRFPFSPPTAPVMTASISHFSHIPFGHTCSISSNSFSTAVGGTLSLGASVIRYTGSYESRAWVLFKMTFQNTLIRSSFFIYCNPRRLQLFTFLIPMSTFLDRKFQLHQVVSYYRASSKGCRLPSIT